MNRIAKISLFLLAFLPFSCYEEEDELKRTECGNNVFDVEMDCLHFTEGRSHEPASVVVSGDKVCFSLHGDVKDHDEWNARKDRRTLSFTFPLDSMKLEKFSDLVVMDSLVLNLADSCVVEWKRDYRVDTLQVHRGWLKFSRSKLIGVDGERNSVFLSGDFDMDYEPLDSFGVPSHSSDSLHFMNDYVSGDGWFDVVITRSNFDKK